VLCNFGETKYLGTEKGPRMLLLDSLKTKKPTRLRTAINRFGPFISPFVSIEDCYKNGDLSDNMFMYFSIS
jgi:hypothetical protein